MTRPVFHDNDNRSCLFDGRYQTVTVDTDESLQRPIRAENRFKPVDSLFR